jgi:prepilin-type N-terminal cleavage/methylation domain-containing protein
MGMNRKAFTLIELLVVIAIVGILSSVIYTNITGIRDRARITAGIRFDSSTLHSIGDQLVGEWTFDSPNLPLIDTSGFGNVGTCTTCPTYATTSGYNNKGAESFDGTNDSIIIPHNSNMFRSDGIMTISAWVNFLSIGSIKDIVNKGWNRVWLTRTSVNTFTFNLNNSALSSCNSRVYTDTTKFYFVTATYDGSSISMYVDGALSTTCNIGSVSLDAQTDSLRIGSQQANGQYWNGIIDDVRIYSSALSSSDIQKLYAEGKNKYVSSI